MEDLIQWLDDEIVLAESDDVPVTAERLRECRDAIQDLSTELREAYEMFDGMKEGVAVRIRDLEHDVNHYRTVMRNLAVELARRTGRRQFDLLIEAGVEAVEQLDKDGDL